MPTLWRHQEEAKELLQRRRRLLLADPPGAGKSYPALAAAAELGLPTVVVCPAYLRPLWRDYAEAFGFDDCAVVTSGRDAFGERLSIVSYELAKARAPEVAERAKILVYDEAHRLRNRKTANFRTAYAFARRVPYLWLLSGTPVVRNGGDLWAYLRLLYPYDDAFRSYWRWVQRRCVLRQTPWATEVGELRNVSEAIGDFRGAYLRRDRETLAISTPPVVHYTLPVDDAGYEREARRALREVLGAASKTEKVAALHTLRRHLCRPGAPKVEAAVSLVEDVAPSSLVLIYAWYRDSARTLADAFAVAGRKVWLVDGSTSPKERVEAAASFLRSGDGVLVATLASLGEGVNLDGVGTVVLVEEDYTAAVVQQAISRTLRATPLAAPYVCVYALRVRRSPDESVARIAARKATLAAEVERELERLANELGS